MKFYKLIAMVLIIPFMISCSMQVDPETAGKNLISENDLRVNTRYLSHDLLEGRGTGTNGLKIAGEYIATQFAIHGVEPGGANGTYFQEVPLVNYQTMTPIRFEFVKGRGKLALSYRTDFVVNTGRIEPRVQLNKEIVFVGYGIDAPEQNWNDYKDVDVTDKILLMLVNDPPSEDPALFGGKAMTYYGRWTYKNEIAGLKGAAGVLLIHMTEKAGYGWNVVQGSWASRMSALKPKAGDPPKSSVEGWITLEMAKRLFEMAGQNFNDQISKAGTREFVPVKLGVNLNLNFRNDIEEVLSQNVVGIVKGKIEDEYVAYTSHLDHFGIGNPVNGDNIYNGAVDNASGCAGMIEIGKAFANIPEKPNRSIIFLAVTGEEQGLLGSGYYALNPLYPLNKTIANINFDSFTIHGRFENMTALGSERSTIGAVVEKLAIDNALTVAPDTAPEKGYFFRSDHFSFAKVGVPAVFIGNGNKYVGHPEEWGAEQANIFTSNHYHQPSDEFDPNWNIEGFVQTSQLVFQLGWRMAALTEWPVWIEGSQFKSIRESSLKK